MNPVPARAVTLLRDFVNSAEPQVGTDQLTPPTAAECLHGLGLADADDVFTAAQLTLLVGFREGVRNLLLAHAGHGMSAVTPDVLDRLLATVPLTARLHEGSVTMIAVKNDTAHRVIAGVLSAVVGVPSEDWARLKVCARDSCRWAFFDSSRNRSGRWCSMAGCGNIVKMRRAYQSRSA